MMNNDDSQPNQVILTESVLHPYEDPTIHTSQSEPPAYNDREPFNDAVKHGDLIVGYQRTVH